MLTVLQLTLDVSTGYADPDEDGVGGDAESVDACDPEAYPDSPTGRDGCSERIPCRRLRLLGTVGSNPPGSSQARSRVGSEARSRPHWRRSGLASVFLHRAVQAGSTV